MNMDLEDSQGLDKRAVGASRRVRRSGESPRKVGRCQSAVTKLV